MGDEQEQFSGVKTLVARMQTNPEEFFEGSKSRWAFIYTDYFKDSLTEIEKGMLHDSLKRVRRLELDARVLKEIMKDTNVEKEEYDSEDYDIPEIPNPPSKKWPIK